MDAQQLVLLIGLVLCVVVWVEFRVHGLRDKVTELETRIAGLEGLLGGPR
jgi:hypothetical protein